MKRDEVRERRNRDILNWVIVSLAVLAVTLPFIISVTKEIIK